MDYNCIRHCAWLLLFYSSLTFSGPWLSSGPWPSSANLATKSDIDLLADLGFIQAPILTWPIAWDNIGPSLLSQESKKQLKTAPSSVQLAYFRVLSQYQNATNNALQTSAYLSGGHRINPFRTFEFQPRNDIDGGVAIEKQANRWAGKLAVNYSQYNDLTNNVHLDNSYFYGFFGNWGIGFDKMPRWWGPSYVDSMILSANAPPLPTFTVQRMKAESFQTKWLSWIGPWSITTSLSMGEPDAPIAHPLIWLTNVAFRPIQSLQFSISRVAFFAGDSRPFNAEMFKNLLIVNDNCSPEREGASYCEKYSPGTELWEVTADWNWFKTWSIPASFYLQTLFKDRVPYNSAPWLYSAGFNPPIPGRTAFLAGGNSWLPIGTGLMRLYAEFEYTFTYVYYFWGEFINNIYGYSQYPYTYYGKLLGSPLGGEAKAINLGGVFTEASGNSDTFLVRFLKLNGLRYQEAGSPGYPFAHQDVLWLSLGRTIVLPKKLGQLTGQLAYLKSLDGIGLKSSPSGFLTWSKDF